MEPAPPAAYSGSDPLARLRHRWWLVALVTGLGLAAAGGWLDSRPPVWESTTAVLVHPAGQDTNVVGGRTQGEVNLDTEAQLVRSTAVAAGAAGRLGLDPVPEDLAGRVRVAVPPNTSVLTITFAAGTPGGAQAGAQAFAESYLEHRERSARADLTARVTAIEATLDELSGSLTSLNQRLVATFPGTAAAANLDSQRSTVVSQMNALTGRRNELATATVSPGLVISEARLPAEPSRPVPAVVLASGAALGLVTGLGAAGLAERLVRRVRHPADLTHRLGLPVLAGSGPRAAAPAGEIASPYGPAGRCFDRLRNEVIAAAGLDGPPDGIPRGRMVVVTSPTGGTVAGPVAANLAASLARSGHDTILVEAAGAGPAGALTRLFSVAAAPGLSELLAGRASLAGVLQRPPRYPRLQLVTAGGIAIASGLLQSPALRTVLAAAAAETGYVVVAAPATASSADAQSLASHADLALLVVARRTRLSDVADAAAQLRRVGTALLGAVLVPRPREATRTDRHPADLSLADRPWLARRLRRTAPPAPRPVPAADGQTLVEGP